MRVRQSLSTTITSVLGKDKLRRQALIEKRFEFARRALATKKEAREGFGQMYVHQLTARKTTPPPAVWDHLDADYQALQSTEAGSMFHFLMTVLSNGFRIYPKSGDAKGFKQKATLKPFDDALMNGLADGDKALFTALNISSLLNGLTMQFRGKGSDIASAELHKRLCLILTGTTSTTNQRVNEVCDIATQAIMGDYGTYAELKDNAVFCANHLASAMGLNKAATSSIDKAFAVIESLASSEDPDVKSSTIAFDPDLPLIEFFDKPVDALLPIAVHYGSEYVAAGGKAKDCVKSITTANGNGLSFLFSKGLNLFKTKSVNELMSLFSVSNKHKEQLLAIQHVAKHIVVSSTFGASATKDALIYVQSFIDSTLANHFARTSSSLDALEAFEPLTANSHSFDTDAFAEIGVSQEAFDVAFNYFSGDFQHDVEKAKRLVGQQSSAASLAEAIAAYETLLGRASFMNGTLNQLNNLFKHNADNQYKLEQAVPVPVSLFKIGSTVLNIEADRALLEADKHTLLSAFNALSEHLMQQFDIKYADIIARKAAAFADACAATQRKALKRSKHVAARFYISRFTSLAYRGSEAVRRGLYQCMLDAGLCEDSVSKQELREHIFNRMHYAFLSPYDGARKKLLHFDTDAMLCFDPLKAIDFLLTLGITDADNTNLRALKFTIICNGLDTVDVSLLQPIVALSFAPTNMLHLLEQDTITGNEASKLVNAMVASKLSGINYRLNKQSFVHRYTLKLVTGNRLFIEPKDAFWDIPEQLLDSSRAAVFESSYCVINHGVLDVVETVNAIAKLAELSEKDQAKVSWLLRQIPARFYIQPGIAGWGQTLNVYQVNEGRVSKFKKVSGLVPIKIGKRAGKLRKALNALFTDAKVSPPTLTLERAYHINGDDVLIEDKSQRQVVFNLPLYSAIEADTSDWKPKYIIGIDPSESGFGVGLLTLKGDIVDHAFVHCHSMSDYFDAKTQHLCKTQPRQEYKKPFSNYLSKLRDTAVGEITNALDNLLLGLDGLLIFEMVGNNSAPAFRDIWEPTIQRYTWGDNDAQNARRAQHWGGATRWLTTLIDNNGEQLKAFPGARIGGANTSYPCPECGRNSIAIVKEELNAKQTVTVVDGHMIIGNQRMTIFEPDAESMQIRKRQGLSPLFVPANRVIKDATTTNTNGREVTKMIIRSLRRPTTGRASKLSTISQYYCVFDDCQSHAHSDAFAAINIARKYLSNKVQAII